MDSRSKKSKKMVETDCIIFNKGVRADPYFLHMHLKADTKVVSQPTVGNHRYQLWANLPLCLLKKCSG